MAKYIRELLEIPTQVNKGDFVLNLAAGVSEDNAAATLKNYVVTPQLTACFDQAPEPPSPEDWGGVEQCVSFCSSLHIQDGEATDELVACVMDADCAAIGPCFQAAFPEER